MKKKPKLISKLYERIKEYIYDDELDIQERSFILLSFIALIALVVALLSGIIMSQTLITSLFTFAGVLILSGMVFWTLRSRNIRRSMIIISAFVVFIYQPVLFFTSSGIYSGTPIWFFFSTFYIVVILSGTVRSVFLAGEAVVTIICYVVGYLKPEFIITYSREEAHIDSIAALVIVAVAMGIIITFQNSQRKEEMLRTGKVFEEIGEMGRAKSRFFSSMSHELRTPINTILGLNEVIMRRESVPEDIRKEALTIDLEGKRLLTVVNDILDVSKIESGKMSVVAVEYDVGYLISEVVNPVWKEAEDKGLEFKVDIDPSIPSVLFGDEVKIKQILVTLLENAVRYTREGYVTLHAECEKFDDENVRVTISVQDTGIGIKRDELPLVFNSFSGINGEEQAHSIKKSKGSGLSLNIASRLAKLMGGEIRVSSVFSVGSVFTFSLRQKIRSEMPLGNINIFNNRSDGSQDVKASFSAPEARVLIVDDNELNLEVESKHLEGIDINVDTAFSGREALDKTFLFEYDIILMDHLMPEMDGIECLKRIRQQEDGVNNNTPMIVLTANAGADEQKLYSESGFEGYLTKPVSAGDLWNAIERLLPEEKIIRKEIVSEENVMFDKMSTAFGYSKKSAVLITTSSVCDLPDKVISKLGIPVIPFMVTTDTGTFRDNIDIQSSELLQFMSEGRGSVMSGAPDEDAFERFFAENFKKTHHIIHISFSSSMSDEFEHATAAAKAFDNVTVYDSGCVSGSQGLLVLTACKLAEQNKPVDDIISELDRARAVIHCSFILADTEYMMRKNFLSEKLDRFMKSLAVRPSIGVNRHGMGVDNLYIGRIRSCYKSYIAHALKNRRNADNNILFITYSGIDEETLEWINREVRKRIVFEKTVFVQASAAISSNCGAGSFGLLFMDKRTGGSGLNELISREV